MNLPVNSGMGWRMLALLLWATSALSAKPLDLLILKNPESSLHERLAETFIAHAWVQKRGSQTLNYGETPRPFPEARAYLTIGVEATRLTCLQAAPQALVLSVLIPEATYRELDECRNAPSTRAAIFLDQPFSRQLNLASLIRGPFTRVGTLLGPKSQQRSAEIEAAIQSSGRQWLNHTLSADDNPARSIEPIIRDIEVFFAIPDTQIFNHSTAKWVLYAGLRLKVPIIGYSQNYVESGATAAVFSTPEDFARQAAEMLEAHWEHPRLPLGNAPPHYFRIRINDKVIKQLGLPATDETLLEQQLKSLEQMRNP